MDPERLLTRLTHTAKATNTKSTNPKTKAVGTDVPVIG